MRNEKGQFVKGDVKDISGKRFSHLTVIKLDHIRDKKSYWLCKCDCGREKVVRSDCLKVIQSCGCVKKQQDVKNLHIKDNHNLHNHPAYSVWDAMMARCSNEHNHAYKDYGGRGVRVCEEWKNVRNFCKWADDMGFEKGRNLSIERIDVNGNYEPSNCIWIDRKEQVYNRRNTIRFTDIDGVKKSVAKEARIRGVNPKCAVQRYNRGVSDPYLIFYKGNLQKDFPELFGGSRKREVYG